MSFILTQKVTYWPTTGTNEDSEKTWGAPVTIDARYAEKDGVMINDKGEEQKTMWIIYSRIEIPKRSLVVLGENTSATPIDSARLMPDNKSNSSFTNMIKSVV